MSRPFFPWHHVISLIARDSDPLYTLHARTKILRALSEVSHALRGDVHAFGWKVLASSSSVMLSRKGMDIGSIYDMLRSTDFGLVPDESVWHFFFTLGFVPKSSVTNMSSVQLFARNSCVSKLRQVVVHPLLFSIRVSLNVEASRCMSQRVAKEQYMLSASDLTRLGGDGGNTDSLTMVAVDVLDTCHAVYGSSNGLEEARTKRVEAALGIQKRTREAMLICNYVISLVAHCVENVVSSRLSSRSNPPHYRYRGHTCKNIFRILRQYDARFTDFWKGYIEYGNYNDKTEMYKIVTKWALTVLYEKNCYDNKKVLGRSQTSLPSSFQKVEESLYCLINSVKLV